MLWVWLLACIPTTGDDESSVSATGDSESEVASEPDWTVEGFERSLVEGLAFGLPLATDVKQAYFAVVALGDEGCPGGDGVQLAGSVPVEGCTAESGAFYQGISTFTEIEMSDHHSWVLTGDFTMRDADGDPFKGGGTATMILGEGSDLTRSTVSGTWSYPGAEGALSYGYSVGEFTVTQSPMGLGVDGGLSTGESAIDYQQLTVSNTCNGLLGDVEVRSPGGHWWHITFAGECDVCGTVLDGDGLEQGELCIEDLSAFVEAAADTGE